MSRILEDHWVGCCVHLSLTSESSSSIHEADSDSA